MDAGWFMLVLFLPQAWRLGDSAETCLSWSGDEARQVPSATLGQHLSLHMGNDKQRQQHLLHPVSNREAQYHVEVKLRYMLLQVNQEHGTVLLIIIQAPTVGLTLKSLVLPHPAPCFCRVSWLRNKFTGNPHTVDDSDPA